MTAEDPGNAGDGRDLGRHGRYLSWMLSADLLGKGLGVVFFAYVARQLEVTEHGWYGVYLAFVPILGVLMTAGLNDLLVREVSKDASALPGIMTNGFLIQIAFFGLLFMGVRYFCAAVGYDPALQRIVGIAAVTAFFAGVYNAHVAALSAYEAFRPISLLQLFPRLVVVPGGMLVLALGGGVFALVVFMAASHAVQAGLAHGVLWRRHGMPWGRLNGGRLRYVMAHGAPMVLGRVGSRGYYSADLPLLQAIGPAAAAGYYAVGARFQGLLLTFGDLFETLFYPVLGRRAQSGGEAQAFAVLRFLKFMALMGFPMAVGAVVVGEALVVFLAGERYAPGAPVLAVLVATLALAFLDRAITIFLRTRGRQGLPMAVYTGAFAAKAAAAIVVLPVWGVTGLLIVHATISCGITLLLGFFLLRVLPELRLRELLGALWGPALAAFIMGGALWFVRDESVLWTIPAGAVVYGAGLAALRVFDDFDRELVRSALQSKGRA